MNSPARPSSASPPYNSIALRARDRTIINVEFYPEEMQGKGVGDQVEFATRGRHQANTAPVQSVRGQEVWGESGVYSGGSPPLPTGRLFVDDQMRFYSEPLSPRANNEHEGSWGTVSSITAQMNINPVTPHADEDWASYESAPYISGLYLRSVWEKFAKVNRDLEELLDQWSEMAGFSLMGQPAVRRNALAVSDDPISHPTTESTDSTMEEVARSYHSTALVRLGWVRDQLLTDEAVTNTDRNDLFEALIDLSGVTRESEEEGYDPPSTVAIGNARRLLDKMYRIYPQRFEVYSTEDAEVAIDAQPSPEGCVTLLCDSDGDVLCLTDLPSRWNSKRFPMNDRRLDEFIQDALRELATLDN